MIVAPTGDIRMSSWVERTVRWLGSAVPDSPRLIRVVTPQYARTTLSSIARAAEAADDDAVDDTAEAADAVEAEADTEALEASDEASGTVEAPEAGEDAYGDDSSSSS